MINQVFALVLEETEKVLGVRIKTVDNKFYDMELEAFHKIVKMDVNSLEQVELFPYKGKLVSHDEYNLDMLVEDATENPTLLNQLKGYFISQKSENIIDPALQAKRSKKIFDLKQAYYNYMPDHMLPEFAEYHLQHFEGNRGLYTTLTDAQFSAIKQYSRWRTRLLFNERSQHQLLRTKPKKAEKLVQIMGTADDWQYDGLVDTGYAGGSHCELGHALRYEHYAYSPSLRRSIIFGSSCVADFFEIPPKLLREIVGAQDLILKETKTLIFLMNTGHKAEYEQPYLDKLPALKGVSEKRLLKSGTEDYEWVEHITNFNGVGLPLTRSMKRLAPKYATLLKNALHVEDLEKRTDKARNDLLRTPYDQNEINYILDEEYTTDLEREVHILLLNHKYTHPLVQKYFGNNTVLKDSLRHMIFTTGSDSRGSLKRLSMRLHTMVEDTTNNIIRLQTKADRVFNKGYKTTSRRMFSPLTAATLDAILHLTVPLVTYEDKKDIGQRLNFSVSMDNKQDAYDKYLRCFNKLINGVDNLTSLDYIKEVRYYKDGEPRLESANDAIVYTTYPINSVNTYGVKKPKTSETETTNRTAETSSNDPQQKRHQTLMNMISEMDNVRNTPIVNLGTFIYDVTDTIKRRNGISEKQEALVRKHFDMILANIQANAKQGVLPSKHTALAIIETYSKYGTLSEKQLAYISDANSIILKSKNKQTLEDTDDLPF